MRTLILIPIVHTEHDMGSLVGKLKEEYVRQYGSAKWAEHVRTIEDLWTGIQKAVSAENLPYAKVRLYQDGLPECGREAEIVAEVAAKGSPNHQLLLDLMTRGATLTGTEAPDLLIAEYRLHKESLAQASPDMTRQLRAQAKTLLGQRDQHIAARIDSTLQPGETGILFIGLAHSVAPLLSKDIRVKNLLPELSRRAKEND